MRNVKKWLALGLATIMTFGVVACGNGDTPVVKESESNKATESVAEPEVKEPVLLEWYFRGNGQQKDTEEVEARVNELLKNYPGLEHVSININCFPSADYETKVVINKSTIFGCIDRASLLIRESEKKLLEQIRKENS